MKNWKTTLFGFLSVAVAMAPQFLPAKYQGTAQQVTAVLAGLGLVAAKDSNVTGA